MLFFLYFLCTCSPIAPRDATSNLSLLVEHRTGTAVIQVCCLILNGGFPIQGKDAQVWSSQQSMSTAVCSGLQRRIHTCWIPQKSHRCSVILSQSSLLFKGKKQGPPEDKQGLPEIPFSSPSSLLLQAEVGKHGGPSVLLCLTSSSNSDNSL